MTDRFVATARPGPTGRDDFFDTKATGLVLRVSHSHRSWAFAFTSPVSGKRARLTLGSYPAKSLAEARTLAMEARSTVESGSDPRSTSEGFGNAASIRHLVQEFQWKHADRNLRSAAAIERRLAKNVLPVIGSIRVSELTRRDINRVVDRVLERNAPVEANRVFEDLRRVLRWAVARGELAASPMEGMRKPSVPVIRERVLSDDELSQWLARLGAAFPRSATVRRILLLCLLTAQRVGEVAGMGTEELDLRAGVWRLPGSRTKNGHPHTVPLSSPVVAIIKEAIAQRGENSAFVFPSGQGALPAHAVATTVRRAQMATKALPRGRFGIAPWTAHDLRRTALTGMARLGVAPVVLGHVANHRTTTRAGVTLAVYSRYEYDEEKRAALDAWAARVETLRHA